MSKFEIKIEVEEYADKYWPLHEGIGNGSYKDKPIAFCVAIPDHSPFIVVDGKPYIIHIQKVVQTVVEHVVDGQNSSEPDWKALYIGQLIEDLYHADRNANSELYASEVDWAEESTLLAQALSDLGVDPAKAIDEFGANYHGA